MTVSVVIILPNQGSIDYRLPLMPYRCDDFAATDFSLNFSPSSKIGQKEFQFP